MPKKYEPDSTDKDVFDSAMRGVKPLAHTKIEIKPAPIRKRVATPSIEKSSNPFQLYNETDLTDEVSGDDLLEFHRGGLQHKVLRKLRRGQYNVEATLDMHGMRVTEAREAISDFLLDCLRNNVRHVIIIHGKGHGKAKPVLKNKLNQWLRHIEHVLAFCSATQQDGRSGAIYVLLKGSFSGDE
jgi:DNA-nicking Smr family endonuclease